MVLAKRSINSKGIWLHAMANTAVAALMLVTSSMASFNSGEPEKLMTGRMVAPNYIQKAAFQKNIEHSSGKFRVVIKDEVGHWIYSYYGKLVFCTCCEAEL